MTDFELRGTFYLGEQNGTDPIEVRAERVMEHLLEFERNAGGVVRDAAVSLDTQARTIEIEIVVSADSFLDAHRIADAAVADAFDGPGKSDVHERSVHLVTA